MLTPQVAEKWNEEVREGKRAPWVILGMDEQTYLTMAEYWKDVLRYIQQLRAVVDYYRNEPSR